ncbi:MAG: hypothetical protein CUN55_10960 [Phototrophicales bacterium]|nr:MAG: hypothetical protein CUN55_10960 [Phototrophicales bacterium]
MSASTPKIGLVLGGGGSRGIAHIGVLDVLQDANIHIDFIVGTSMGGIIGALFAAGIDPDIMAERISDLVGGNLFVRNAFSARARQAMVRKYLEPILADKTFADLNIPLTVMAVDVIHGQEISLNEGELIPALLATSAVPAVFPTVEINGLVLADGGVIDSLATHVGYAQNPDILIAVDVYPPLENDTSWHDPLSDIMGFASPLSLFSINDMPSMLASIWRSVRIMTWYLHEKRLQEYPPHILLRPAVESYGSLDFRDLEGPLVAGADAMLEQLPKLQALIAQYA